MCILRAIASFAVARLTSNWITRFAIRWNPTVLYEMVEWLPMQSGSNNDVAFISVGPVLPFLISLGPIDLPLSKQYQTKLLERAFYAYFTARGNPVEHVRLLLKVDGYVVDIDILTLIARYKIRREQLGSLPPPAMTWRVASAIVGNSFLRESYLPWIPVYFAPSVLTFADSIDDVWHIVQCYVATIRLDRLIRTQFIQYLKQMYSTQDTQTTTVFFMMLALHCGYVQLRLVLTRKPKIYRRRCAVRWFKLMNKLPSELQLKIVQTMFGGSLLEGRVRYMLFQIDFSHCPSPNAFFCFVIKKQDSTESYRTEGHRHTLATLRSDQ